MMNIEWIKSRDFRHPLSSSLLVAALVIGVAGAELSLAGPVSGEEARRQAAVFERLEIALSAEATDAGKLRLIERAMKDEQAVELRRRMLDVAAGIGGPDLEKFLTTVLSVEEDAGLRSEAATLLGRLGSEKCLATLADVARNDRTSFMLIGDVGGRSSARRAATFAIAELAARFPELAGDAAAKLRALPAAQDVKDPEDLADARIQALYQITRDDELLQPFYQRLENKDPGVRERGVIAFQFLELKHAPVQIVDALKDSSSGVRGSSAMVLGRIGDPQTSAALMSVAGDKKEDALVRYNAIFALGHMKAAAAADLMETLLMDPDPRIQSTAALALYRITGRKVEQLPKGINLDEERE